MKGKIKHTGSKDQGILHNYKKGTPVKVIEVHSLHYLCEDKKGVQAIVQNDQIDIIDEFDS